MVRMRSGISPCFDSPLGSPSYVSETVEKIAVHLQLQGALRAEVGVAHQI